MSARLPHPPTPPFAHHGCRNFDDAIECEANWLGPAPLISVEAALYIVTQGLDDEAASRLYRVSRDVIRMRINVGGAR
jgi:hypothetical protein